MESSDASCSAVVVEDETVADIPVAGMLLGEGAGQALVQARVEGHHICPMLLARMRLMEAAGTR